MERKQSEITSENPVASEGLSKFILLASDVMVLLVEQAIPLSIQYVAFMRHPPHQVIQKIRQIYQHRTGFWPLSKVCVQSNLWLGLGAFIRFDVQKDELFNVV